MAPSPLGAQDEDEETAVRTSTDTAEMDDGGAGAPGAGTRIETTMNNAQFFDVSNHTPETVTGVLKRKNGNERDREIRRLEEQGHDATSEGRLENDGEVGPLVTT